MTRFASLRRGTPFLLGVALLALAAPAAQALEAQLYAITTWNAGCSGSTRTSWDDMGDEWYDAITDDDPTWWWGHGSQAYSRDRRQVNGNMADSWFTDSSIVSFGNDNTYIDEGDAVMICTHGNEASGRWYGKMRIDEAGSGNCKAWQGHMELGDLDLEFLHLSSCQSLDDNQWSAEWLDSFNGLHQVDGFHGLMWISSWRADDYEDFADDAFECSIADAWLDNLYDNNASGNDDQCPVAYATGSTEADLLNRLGNERYNYVFSDPTSPNWWGAMYISGCDPANEDVCGDDIY